MLFKVFFIALVLVAVLLVVVVKLLDNRQNMADQYKIEDESRD